jgi:hypothetical protein
MNYCNKYNIPTRKQEDVFNFNGKKHSQKVCDLISKTHKHKKLSEETKAKLAKSKMLVGIGHKKKRTDGYVAIYFPDHPQSNKDGYIMEHTLMMECFIGRHLKDNEIVHHINNDKADNRKDNLKLMTRSEHTTYHLNNRWESIKNGKS